MHWTPSTVLTVALAVAAIAGCGSGATQPSGVASGASAALPRGFLGVNAQFVPNIPPRTADAHLDAIAGYGIETVRFDAPWYTAEPSPPAGGAHRYDWEVFDAAVARVARRGLRWLPILHNSAPWAASARAPGSGQPALASPPADFRQFAAYARAFAARYGRGGTFWRDRPELPGRPVVTYEIWNEPNEPGTWVPQPDPAAYASLYLAAREAIVSVDSSARVLVGGLSNNDPTGFLTRMWDAHPRLQREVDAVGLHPYGPDPDAVFERIAAARRTLDALGAIDVELAITELGWPTQGETGGFVQPDEVRARYLAQVSEKAAVSDCGIALFLPHTWITREQDPRNVEHWYGLVHPDGMPTRAAESYGSMVRSLTRRADRLGPRRPLCGRSPVLELAPVAARQRRGCVRATVRLAGVPLRGSEVRFRLVGRSGRAGRHRVRRRTDEEGVALACFAGDTQIRRAQVSVAASREDLALAAHRTVAVPMRRRR